MLGEISPRAIRERDLKRQQEERTGTLIRDIHQAKIELDAAVRNFDFADSDDLVDLYSYRIIAAQTKYNLLLKQAKEQGVTYQEYLAGVGKKQ